MTNLEKLGNVIKELEIQSNDLKDFNKVYSEIGKLQGRISESLTLLQDNNNGFSSISEQVKCRLEESKEQFNKLESEMLKKIQELYQDNKNFQKELDSSLISRLDKHKSDIQLEIRDLFEKFEKIFNDSNLKLSNSINDVKLFLKLLKFYRDLSKLSWFSFKQKKNLKTEIKKIEDKLKL